MADDYGQWYERVYPKLAGHGIWLRGGELNTVPVEDAARRPFRFLIARLSTYQDTAASFTHTLLYAVAGQVKGVYPDLAFLPPRHDRPIFEGDRVPWLLGTQTRRGPEFFDLIGFSNSIVQELVNLPTMLERSGVPLLKSERLKTPGIPLVILGGANALHSSVLWTNDPMVDGVFVGEAGEAIVKLLEIGRDGKAKGLDKEAILKRMESVPGFFQPDQRRKTVRKPAFPGRRDRFVADWPVPFAEGSAGEGHLSISEGCPCFCSFCAESYGRKPYREYPAALVVERALAMKTAMGIDALELFSFSFNLHSEFHRILWELVPLFHDIGLKSQRLDVMARDPDLMAFLHAVGKSSVTCGIEGISERLRHHLHKNLPDEVLIAGLRAVLRAPLREVKIFLIATGLEKEADFAGLQDLLDYVKMTLQNTDRRPRIIFSVTPLVRFPWTPLEFADAVPVEPMQRILDTMRGMVHRATFEFRQAADMPEYWLSQVLVRAADPRLLECLLRAIRETGFVYGDGVPAAFVGRLQDQLRAAGMDEAALLAGHTFEEGEGKPWASIGTGVRREFLFEQYKLARRFREEDYCLSRGGQVGECRACGACPDKAHIQLLTTSAPAHPNRLEDFQARVVAARQDAEVVALVVEVPARARGLDRRYLGAAVARAILQAAPELAAGYRRFETSFWGANGEATWITGDDIVSLAWSRAAAARLRAGLAAPAFLRKVNGALAGWGTVRGLAAGGAGAWKISILSPTAFDSRKYFAARGLKFTLMRGEGGYRLEFSKDSLKKRIVRGVHVTPRGDGSEVDVVPGEKFEVGAFVKEAFVLREPDDWVRIESVARLMGGG